MGKHVGLPCSLFLVLLLGLVALACGGGAGGAGDQVADPALHFATQPQAATVAVGQTATFTASAAGSGILAYQWEKDGASIAGARAPGYTTPAASLAEDGARFRVLVTDAAGASIVSEDALLTVNAATRRNQHYVDPVAGSDTGNGSASHPWKTLQDVVDHRVETRTWKGPLPYTAGQQLVPVNAGAPVQPGDTIWLLTGDHGALVIQSAYNAAPVTLAAQDGHTPRFSRILVQSSQHWILRGLSVSPTYGSVYSAATMVTIENHSWRGPASDICLDGCQIFSVPDEQVWTSPTDWDTKAASAVNASGDRVTVRGCRIRNTDFGIAMTGKGAWVVGNTVDGFAGDGLRGLGDDGVFEYNVIKNRRDVNDNHPDGFQSWSVGPGGVGTGVVRNIVLRGNVFIAYEHAGIPFAGTLQGIGCFDGIYENWVVENNVVLTDHWHGISFYGARNVRIVNNTVLDLNAVSPGPPWIMVTDHKLGEPSRNCLVRNNLTTDLSVSGVDNAVDHNQLLPLNATHYFLDLQNLDVHLAAGSPALDQGSAVQAPLLDAEGQPRPQGGGFDLGAYERQP
jgi:hypothetical protein